MSFNLKTFLLVILIILIVVISRFTNISDIIKQQISIFLLPTSQEIVTGFTPYLNKELEIRNELKKLVELTNVNASGLLLFHDKNKNLTVIGDYLFTILFEETAPGLINTTGMFVDLPITSMKGFGAKNLNECHGWEIGNELTHPLFTNLPSRPAIACSIKNNNRIVGVIYLVDSYDKKSLTDLAKLIPIVQKTTETINKLTNSN